MSKIISPIGTLSYPQIHEPKEDSNKKKKYGCAIIFPKGADLSELKKAAIAVLKEKHGDKTAEMIRTKKVHWPFHDDADEVEGKGYPEGSTYMNCRSDRKPGCVYRHADPATNKPAVVDADDIEEVFYPGAQVRLSVNAFYFDRDGKKGVTFGLNNLQKMGEGDRLDSRRAAEDEFDADDSAADLNDLESTEDNADEEQKPTKAAPKKNAGKKSADDELAELLK